MLEIIILLAVCIVAMLVACGLTLTSPFIESPTAELVSIAFAPILTGCFYIMGKVSGIFEQYPLLQKIVLGGLIWLITLVVLTYILVAIVSSHPTEDEKKQIKR